MSELTLYGTILMSLTIGVLVGLILILIRPADADVAPIESIVHAARADQLRRAAVLGTPTSEQPIVTRMDVPPRGLRVTYDAHEPGRHRRISAAASARPSSYAKMGLDEALAWLAFDRVKREAEHSQFKQLIGVYAR